MVTRGRHRLAAVLCAAGVGGVVGTVAESSPGRAHTCMKITGGTPPTTVLVPPNAGSCDFSHHPGACTQFPTDGGIVVICIDD